MQILYLPIFLSIDIQMSYICWQNVCISTKEMYLSMVFKNTGNIYFSKIMDQESDTQNTWKQRIQPNITIFNQENIHNVEIQRNFKSKFQGTSYPNASETHCKSQKAERKNASSMTQKQLPSDSLAQIFYRNPMLQSCYVECKGTQIVRNMVKCLKILKDTTKNQGKRFNTQIIIKDISQRQKLEVGEIKLLKEHKNSRQTKNKN